MLNAPSISFHPRIDVLVSGARRDWLEPIRYHLLLDEGSAYFSLNEHLRSLLQTLPHHELVSFGSMEVLIDDWRVFWV